VYDQAFALLASHADSLEMGQLLMNQSWVLNRSRQFDDAMSTAHAALAIFQAHGSRADMALVYNNLAVFCEHQGDLDKALEHNLRGLQLFTELNDKRQMANLYLSLGYVHNSRKEFEQALEYFSKSAALMERIGNRYGAGTALMSKGRIYMDTDRLDLAERTLRQSLRIHHELDLKKKIVANELALAKLYLMKQQWPQARQHLAVARAEKAKEAHLRKIAGNMAREVRIFWANAQKLFEWRVRQQLEKKRKEALDRHLNFIVDKTEKYSTLLAESLAESANVSGQVSPVFSHISLLE